MILINKFIRYSDIKITYAHYEHYGVNITLNFNKFGWICNFLSQESFSIKKKNQYISNCINIFIDITIHNFLKFSSYDVYTAVLFPGKTRSTLIIEPEKDINIPEIQQRKNEYAKYLNQYKRYQYRGIFY